MKPPPPMPHDDGCTTHTASAVAIAASTAEPPSCRISSPASAASGLSAATIAAPPAETGAACRSERRTAIASQDGCPEPRPAHGESKVASPLDASPAPRNTDALNPRREQRAPRPRRARRDEEGLGPHRRSGAARGAGEHRTGTKLYCS